MSSSQVTISDVIEKFPDKCFYIGGDSGFFFIGSADEVKEKIPKMNLHNVAELCRKYEVATSKKRRDYYGNQMKKYEDIQSRKVKEFYERIQGGVAIILDNSEDLIGRYWFKEEFEHGTKKD